MPGKTKDIALKVVEAAENKQAADIALLDTRKICDIADYFVIVTGESDRQVQAICEEVAKVLKEDGVLPLHVEGTADSGWILLDFGEVVVHIFSPREREFYQLDELWRKAKPVVRIQ